MLGGSVDILTKNILYWSILYRFIEGRTHFGMPRGAKISLDLNHYFPWKAIIDIVSNTTNGKFIGHEFPNKESIWVWGKLQCASNFLCQNYIHQSSTYPSSWANLFKCTAVVSCADSATAPITYWGAGPKFAEDDWSSGTGWAGIWLPFRPSQPSGAVYTNHNDGGSGCGNHQRDPALSRGSFRTADVFPGWLSSRCCHCKHEFTASGSETSPGGGAKLGNHSARVCFIIRVRGFEHVEQHKVYPS